MTDCENCQCSFKSPPVNREVLFHWLLEIGLNWAVPTSTLHTAMQYVDHMCCHTLYPSGRLQLVAITALLVATKMANRKAVRPVRDYADMTAGSSSAADICAMERELVCYFPVLLPRCCLGWKEGGKKKVTS